MTKPNRVTATRTSLSVLIWMTTVLCTSSATAQSDGLTRVTSSVPAKDPTALRPAEALAENAGLLVATPVGRRAQAICKNVEEERQESRSDWAFGLFVLWTLTLHALWSRRSLRARFDRWRSTLPDAFMAHKALGAPVGYAIGAVPLDLLLGWDSVLPWALLASLVAWDGVVLVFWRIQLAAEPLLLRISTARTLRPGASVIAAAIALLSTTAWASASFFSHAWVGALLCIGFAFVFRSFWPGGALASRVAALTAAALFIGGISGDGPLPREIGLPFGFICCLVGAGLPLLLLRRLDVNALRVAHIRSMARAAKPAMAGAVIICLVLAATRLFPVSVPVATAATVCSVLGLTWFLSVVAQTTYVAARLQTESPIVFLRSFHHPDSAAVASAVVQEGLTIGMASCGPVVGLASSMQPPSGFMRLGAGVNLEVQAHETWRPRVRALVGRSWLVIIDLSVLSPGLVEEVEFLNQLDADHVVYLRAADSKAPIPENLNPERIWHYGAFVRQWWPRSGWSSRLNPAPLLRQRCAERLGLDVANEAALNVELAADQQRHQSNTNMGNNR